MKRIYTIGRLFPATALALVLAVSSCTSTFDEMNTNPDAPQTATSAMLATKVILDMVKSADNSNSEFLCKRMFWGEQIEYNQYNRLEKSNYSRLKALTNAQRMVELALDEEREAYTGLYYFLKGWSFYYTTMEMGDIPYSEALDIENHPYPKYDEQKEVFRGILDDLAKADACFAGAGAFGGDPFYNGDPSLWRKATNVLRLKVLMSLQKRADDTPALRVKETFAAIVSEGNLFAGNEDNLQVTYEDKDGQQNPLCESYTRSINVYAGTHTLIEPLKRYGDYRLFYYFSPMQAVTDPLYLPEGETLLQPDNWDAYRGLDAAGAFSTERAKIDRLMHCRPNEVYRLTYTGVPAIRLGYADMNFILAEAAERGWIAGPAKVYYDEGVRASFAFVKATVPPKYNHGREITDAYVGAYLAGPDVAYKENGSVQERLQQIWMQAYLASYFHLAWDSYFEYRRTGYPVLPVNPDTNLNDRKDRIPVRWLYPEAEVNYNKEQLLIALERQWGGVDDSNQVMWVLK
ncbi:MAG: SusD/RagB family nutrient-binding outer membrane lipoprotein [Parabacteroides sp.]|nr:SusD/RagB family nutrient-binding outer membrane lipoprotein [Parabacteroides sp.]